MNQRKLTYQDIAIALGAFIYPMYTTPFVLKLAIESKRLGFYLLSFILSVFAYCYVPYDTMDITRYYQQYELMRAVNINAALFENTRQWDLAMHVYIWLIAVVGLPKEFVPFSITFVSYCLYFRTFEIVSAYNNVYGSQLHVSLRALLFVAIISTISYFGVASGLRNGLAFALFTYATINLILRDKKTRFLLISLIASAVHISIILPLALLLIVTLFPAIQIYRLLFVVGFVVYISGISEYLFLTAIDLLKPVLIEASLYFPSYMSPDGKWGVNFYEDKNIRTIVFEKILLPLPFICCVIFLLMTRRPVNAPFKCLLYFLVFMIGIISASRTLLYRYRELFEVLFCFYLVLEVSHKGLSEFKRKWILAFVCSLMIVNLGAIYKYRGVYLVTLPDFLYKPTPIIFLQSVDPSQYLVRHEK